MLNLVLAQKWPPFAVCQFKSMSKGVGGFRERLPESSLLRDMHTGGNRGMRRNSHHLCLPHGAQLHLLRGISRPRLAQRGVCRRPGREAARSKGSASLDERTSPHTSSDVRLTHHHAGDLLSDTA